MSPAPLSLRINPLRPSPRELVIQPRHILAPACADSGLEHQDGEAAAEVGGLLAGHASTSHFFAFVVLRNRAEQAHAAFRTKEFA